MRLAERILWGASAGGAVWCAWFAWSTWGRPKAPPLETAHAAALASLPEAVPSPWLASHFAFPLVPQGTPPASWSPLEASLAPDSCGTCHPQQLADWRESWHAAAMGPGTMGQLVDWDGADDALVAKCQTCHAPLAEQLPTSAAYQPDLRDDGLSCAGCHVRAWTRFGPATATAPLDGAPHGGFVARDEFEDAAFCAGCHDFTPTQRSLEGKLLQETFQEWRRTDYARDGVSCQDCHMPGKRHLWKGVHDPEMVKGAIGAEARFQRDGERIVGALVVTNVGAGHRLPTYTTPQITLTVEQFDARGNAIAGTRKEGALARYVTPDLSTERFDTRLLPGESHTLAYDVAAAPGAASVRARVACWPDEAYRRFYTIKLADAAYAPKGRSQIEEALARTTASRFTVWESSTPLPGG